MKVINIEAVNLVNVTAKYQKEMWRPLWPRPEGTERTRATVM